MVEAVQSDGTVQDVSISAKSLNGILVLALLSGDIGQSESEAYKFCEPQSASDSASISADIGSSLATSTALPQAHEGGPLAVARTSTTKLES